MPRAWYEAMAARLRGDETAARAAFAARPLLEKQVLSDPTYGKSLSFLAIVDAGLGHREDALREGKLACGISTFEWAIFGASVVRCNLAVVYAWKNQPNLAFSEFEPLMNRPAGAFYLSQPTYGDFQLNPLWDPLRADPRFASLARRLAPWLRNNSALDFCTQLRPGNGCSRIAFSRIIVFDTAVGYNSPEVN